MPPIIARLLAKMRRRNNNNNAPAPVQHNLNNQAAAVQIVAAVGTELERIGIAPFVSNTTRKNSIAEATNHRDIILEQVLLPDDHVAYQEEARERIGAKVTQWEVENQLTAEEATQVREMLTGENDRGMLFGMLDTEGFIDTMRAYLNFKENNPTGYSADEIAVHRHANNLAEILLDGSEMYKAAKLGDIITLLDNLRQGIAAIPVPYSLRWGTAIRTELNRLHTKINREQKVEGDDAQALEKLLANWPPSFDARLLEHKSRVGTKILEYATGMELFDMPIKDLTLRDACNEELEAMNQALTQAHNVPMFKGVTVVLKPEAVSVAMTAVKRFNDTLNEGNSAVYVRYMKGINTFANVLFGFRAAGKEMTKQELRTQLASDNFLEAVGTLRTLLDELNSQQFPLDPLIGMLTEVSIPLRAGAKTSVFRARYNKIVTTIQEGPATLCPDLLVYEQAKVQSTHTTTSTWYRNNLFESSKGLAEGCAYLFKELNEYHTYFNQLNNFLLSLVTVEGNETAPALEERRNVLERIGIEGIQGSVRNIIAWQTNRGAEAAIREIEVALTALKQGAKFEGHLLSTTIDAIAGFRTAFDPLAKRNFVKGSTVIGELEIATAGRDHYYDNPLNLENSKNPGKGIAIMKGSIDTLVALKNVVDELTKLPDLGVLEQTIDLCKKWNNALLNLSFKEDSERLVEMLTLLNDYPTISVAAPERALESFTLGELSERAGFNITSFKQDLSQRLLKNVEQHFEQEVIRTGSNRSYALRFDMLLKHIAKTLQDLDLTQMVDIPTVNQQWGNITEESFSNILQPFITLYRDRVTAELGWREGRGGKANGIQASDGFSAKERITTFKDAKKQGAAQIQHYLETVRNFAGDLLGSLKGMDTAIFLDKVEPSLFAEIAIAELTKLQGMKVRQKHTFQNLLSSSKIGALPTVLGSMRMTAQVADSIDIIASSFIHAARGLTGVIPDNDRAMERSQRSKQQLKTVIELIGTVGASGAAITAAFVGPFAPIPLLVGGIVTSMTGAISLLMNHQIDAKEAKKYLQEFIEVFANVSEELQAVRNAISEHRVDLQNWLRNILEAQKNIAQYPALTAD